MNSKQKICAIAAGVMAVSNVMPAGVLGADYSKELQEAYKWAYENGVTTMNTIDQANMYGNLTRIAMAKMLANYAINNLGKKPNSSIDCTFRDVTSAMDKAYDNGVTNACQLGIMWRAQGEVQGNFNPNDTVTRAQFGTALSRLLWGDKNNTTKAEEESGVQYYKYHLNALNKAYNGVTIMKDISNPSQNEVRGYVMLMLQRSAGMVGKSTEECTATQQLLCLLEGNCTSACEEAMKDINKDEDKTSDKDDEKEEVKSGKLTVSVEDYSSSVKSIPQQGRVKVNDIKFSADEDITIKSVTLTTAWLTSNTSVKSVWFEKDNARVGSKSSIDTDGIATIDFNGDGVVVKKGETFDLYMELWTTTAGAEISFRITNVKSTAESVKITNDTTTTLRTTTYAVATGEVAGSDFTADYKLGEKESYKMGSFTITNDSPKSDDKVLVIKNITLRNEGTARTDALSKIEVKAGSDVVSAKASIDGRNINITLNDTLQAGRNKTYTLYSNIDYVDGTDQYYTFKINKDSDVVIEEEKSGFGAKVISNTAGTFDAVVIGTGIKVQWGKFNITSTSTLSSVDAGQNSTDVVLAEGTLVASVAARIEDGDTLKISGSNLTGLKNIKLEIADRLYTLRTINDAGTVISTDSVINIPAGTSKVRVLADITKDATGTIEINNITPSSFGNGVYVSNDEKFTANNEIKGLLTIANINITEATFSILNKTTDNNPKTVAKRSQAISVFQGEMQNTEKDDIDVDSIKVTADFAHFGDNNEMTVALYIDGSYIDEQTINDSNTGVSFSNVANLKAQSAKSIELKATPVFSTDITANIDVKFSLNASGSVVKNNNPVSASDISAAKLTLVPSGSVKLFNSSNFKGQAFLKNTNQTIAEWTVEIKNDQAEFTGIIFELSGTAQPVPETIRDLSFSYEGTSNGTIAKKTLTGHDKKIETTFNTVVLEPGTYTFKAIATLGYDSANTNNNKFTLSWVTMWNATGINLNFAHRVISILPNITLEKADKELKRVMTIKITNTSSETMTVTGINFTGTVARSSIAGLTFTDDSTQYFSGTELNIPAKWSKILYVELQTAAENENTVDIKLTGIGVKDSDGEFEEFSTSDTNVAAWKTFEMSYSAK